MKAIEALTSVLCDPEGKCCISGSDDDRRLIDSALADLAANAADRAIEGCPELNMGNYDEVGVERLNDWAIRANDEIDRLHALAAGQATAAPENIRGILARCRDFIDTTKAPAYPAGADLADEIDVLLAAQPAPEPSHVAQAVVQDDLIALRKPTTSAELLWLLKLAHLVISDVDKALEETFAPAQPAVEASRFGSPELQAMIIARCVEKDQADSVQEDAARYRRLAAHCRSTSEHWGGRWSIIIDGPAPKSHDSEDDFDAAVDAARKQGEKHDR